MELSQDLHGTRQDHARCKQQHLQQAPLAAALGILSHGRMQQPVTEGAGSFKSL
ncbi:hypothetical protein GCM10023174_01340 [Chelativorans composti]